MCLNALDRPEVQQHLAPSQLAVGIFCGVEVMIYAAREWIGQNIARPICVLLQTDIRNVFNEMLPIQFLKDTRDHTPSSARFASYCYGTPSYLV